MGETPFPKKEVAVLKGHQGSILAVKYNADGNYCLSGGSDKTIRLWNSTKGTLIQTYRGHGWEILDLDVSMDNSRIASCGGDRMVFMWDVSSGKIIRKFKGHESKVNCVKFNEDGAVAITGSYDRTVKIWDCRSNSFDPIQVIDHAKDSVSSLIVSRYEIIAGSVDGNVRTYDIRNGALITDCIGQSVASVRLSHDFNCLLVSSLDDRILLMDRGSGELLNNFTGHKNSNFKIDSIFSNDDAYVISGSEDGFIYVWDLVDAKVVAKLKGHTGTVCALTYHPREVAMLSASTDETIRVWK